MVGTALQYQRGIISKQDVVSMIEQPEVLPTFHRELARPEGLTMIGCKFKKGLISDQPIEIPEESFFKNQKRKMKELGIEITPPPGADEETSLEGVAGMFD